jgi:hypothetical protein
MIRHRDPVGRRRACVEPAYIPAIGVIVPEELVPLRSTVLLPWLLNTEFTPA